MKLSSWQKNRRKKVIMIIMAVIVLLIIASITAMDREQLSIGERVLRDALTPFRAMATDLGEKISGIPKYFADIDQLTEENEQLAEKVETLSAEVAKLQAYGQENQRLRQVLELSEEMSTWQPKAAEVIGRSTDSWYDTITIKGGLDKGFAPDQPVITVAGLVGRIISVSNNSSEVLLITDAEGAVAAIIQQSLVAGVVEAADSKGSLQMVHIPSTETVVSDQSVVTSGYGGVYPYGLRIGYISEVREDKGGLTFVAEITPYVDFSKLDTVIVLVAAASAAEEPPIASGERLPSEQMPIDGEAAIDAFGENEQ